MLDARALHPGRSARDHLLVLARSNRIPSARIDEVLELAGLTSLADRRAGTFSLGMSQRLGIAAALLGDPAVIVLDEPVNGLDTNGIQWVRSLLRSVADDGRTVFVSSHLMSEMELTADEVVVVGRGRLIAAEPITSFIDAHSQRVTLVRSSDGERLGAALARLDASVDLDPTGAWRVVGPEAATIGDVARREAIAIHRAIHAGRRPARRPLSRPAHVAGAGGGPPRRPRRQQRRHRRPPADQPTHRQDAPQPGDDQARRSALGSVLSTADDVPSPSVVGLCRCQLGRRRRSATGTRSRTVSTRERHRHATPDLPLGALRMLTGISLIARRNADRTVMPSWSPSSRSGCATSSTSVAGSPRHCKRTSSRRTAAGRSRHQPSATAPITLLPSTTRTFTASGVRVELHAEVASNGGCWTSARDRPCAVTAW